jgi:hypothetical protein
MTKCQKCGGKSELFLCREHIAELKRMLADLPWWLDRLSEAAVGDVRLSSGARRVGLAPAHLNGDATLAECIGQFPNERETDLTKARAQRANVTLRRLAATGGVNMRASQLGDAVRNTVTTWARHLAESRGIAFVRPTFIGPLLAGHLRLATDTPSLLAFLSEHVIAIASDEAAGECFHEFRGRTRAIERTVNPPLGTRFLGKCPTWLDQDRGICGTELTCREDAVEVTCPTCRRAHNVNRLQLLMMNDLAREKMTVADILKLNRTLPEEYRIIERTLRRWRKLGADGEPPRLKPRGWLRPCSCGHGFTAHQAAVACCGDCEEFDGRESIKQHSADDEPLYLWSDVRKLATEKKPVRKAVAI